ncbi:GcrA cell cycle regulator [Siculibacillus lacustris]|uniref:GcrA cell cycle regulator n=1 Tax=Siculibacillus lacustris TaxID=1549641 RepID=A0A4Q9VW64_9HYPH|nr:GcrA family cell cycle regulator [Siculibacillus lacustris]TBW39313.1 GcrA cell cycle regulator [Siculibacillus lacustris]
MSWTDDRVELLKKLWSDGLSASQIAGELGGVTRNAVIGKVHRLGLSGRAKAPQPQAQRPKKPTTRPATSSVRPVGANGTIGNLALKSETAPATRPQTAPQPLVYSLSEEPLIANANVLQITEQTCKWPLGDPSTEDFHFCARRSDVGIPYCGYHARIAYQPVSERRRDRRVARM